MTNNEMGKHLGDIEKKIKDGGSPFSEDDFIREFKQLTPKFQFLVAGVIKDLQILNDFPSDYIPFLVKERIGK